MIYRQQDLKQKMAEVAQTAPTTASQVKAARNHMLDARDVVRDIEQQLYYARQHEREQLLDRLQAAKDRALDAQKEFERIGHYAGPLEAQERDRALATEQQKQREADQL